MLETEVRLINPLGLHARAAAQLVRSASSFKSTISIQNASRTADAKSILAVLTLAASCGSTLSISVDGEDENEALEELRQLFENGFGEI